MTKSFLDYDNFRGKDLNPSHSLAYKWTLNNAQEAAKLMRKDAHSADHAIYYLLYN